MGTEMQWEEECMALAPNPTALDRPEREMERWRDGDTPASGAHLEAMCAGTSPLLPSALSLHISLSSHLLTSPFLSSSLVCLLLTSPLLLCLPLTCLSSLFSSSVVFSSTFLFTAFLSVPLLSSSHLSFLLCSLPMLIFPLFSAPQLFSPHLSSLCLPSVNQHRFQTPQVS